MSGVAKNTSHSDFGGDTTRLAQTVSPRPEILSPFLTHRHNAGSDKIIDPRAKVYLKDVKGWMIVIIEIL